MKKIEMLRGIGNIVNENRKRDLRYSYEDIENILKAYVEFVKTALDEDREEKINLMGLGNFTVKHCPEKKGVTYLSGEAKEYITPSRDKIVFKVSQSNVILA